VAAIADVIGRPNLSLLNANRLAETLLGDGVFANMIMLGAGWQQGLVPVSLSALERAIELNGVAVGLNKAAFAIGRLAGTDPDFGKAHADPSAPEDESLDAVIKRREAFLTSYQNAAWSMRYRALVDRVRTAEAQFGSEILTDSVARSLFKLMSYKDEYEVARLHMETGFLAELNEQFEGDFKVNYHLAPPILTRDTDARGRPRKRQFGQWIQPAFRLLAKFKHLRGTPFDMFGYSRERRMERDLIVWYEGIVAALLERLGRDDLQTLVAIAKAPMDIRGYGPVKEAAVGAVKARVTEKLARQPRLPAAAA
jgi:indolepyruvate ferredoxin oxidoreductase